MFKNLSEWIIAKVGGWLSKQAPPIRAYLCDFEQICQNVKLADVLLIEGRSKASRIIKQVTQSPWSHAALYIGKYKNIKNPDLKKFLGNKYACHDETQFLIESEIGFGTIVIPITKYAEDHIRIVRADALTEDDAIKVIDFTINRIGRRYNVQHLLDLLRFLFPWGLYPRRWRSSLFQHNALQPTEDICSSMIADAFQSVHYPILPLVIKNEANQLELIRRNPRLFTPSDFDYSPYFSIVKYPILPLNEKGAYANLLWKESVISNDEGSKVRFVSMEKTIHKTKEIKSFFQSKAYAVVGASTDVKKFGNKVLRCYIQNQLTVHPVNPSESAILDLPCYKYLSELPNTVKSISVVTPPAITEKIVDDAIGKGIKNIWMQPGAESEAAIEKCIQHHINVIADGHCILVELNFKE